VGGRTSYKTDCRVHRRHQSSAGGGHQIGQAARGFVLSHQRHFHSAAALRERREDILPLANSFLKRFAAQANRVITGYTPDAAEMLRKFDWPGNVRQLQNEVQRAVLMCEGKQVDVQDLSISAPRVETPEDETNLTLMEAMERNTIVQMLKETGGNKLETAKRLGIGRQTLYNKIKAYGIET